MIHFIGSVSQQMGEVNCFHQQHDWKGLSIQRCLMDEEKLHKPIHSWRDSLSNLMHVCESPASMWARKSENNIQGSRRHAGVVLHLSTAITWFERWIYCCIHLQGHHKTHSFI